MSNATFANKDSQNDLYSVKLYRQDSPIDGAYLLDEEEGLSLAGARAAALRMVREYEDTRDDDDDASVCAHVGLVGDAHFLEIYNINGIVSVD